MILLDTTVLIDALRGRPAADRIRQRRALGDVPMICAINVEEVWRGVLPGDEEVAATLFSGLRVVSLSVREGELAGRWRRDHAARGVTLHQADCLTAAAAARMGAVLATGNPSDFPMSEVTVEHWPVGS